MKYTVYLIADGGDGIVQKIADWGGEDELRIHTAPFKDDVVIAIDPEEDEDATT